MSVMSDKCAYCPVNVSRAIGAIGAIHKGRPQPRGEGVLVKLKSGHLRTQGGGGGSGAKSGRPQIEIFCQNFRSFNSVLCAKRRELTRQLII